MILRRDARLAALQQGDSASIALTEQLVATRAELSRANAQVSALERAGFELQSLLDRARAAAVASDLSAGICDWSSLGPRRQAFGVNRLPEKPIVS